VRVVIATTQVPFVRGGAEMLAESLAGALREAGHAAEIVSIPFKWYPQERILDHMLACRMLKLEDAGSRNVDLMIGLKFPAYLIPHPNKVMWLLHQHRTAYDAWDSPIGDLIDLPEGHAVREAIQTADDNIIPEFKAVYTLSKTVSDRLYRFNGISSTPLQHPPPGAERFGPGAYGDYVLVPSRITAAKRQLLIVEALALTRQPVRAVFMGGADAPDYEVVLHRRYRQLKLGDRVQWLGVVPEAQKLALYAGCTAVAFVPIDEDYGYVTLEAMLSHKPVMTCTDSGGPLEFVTDGQTGRVVEPEPAAIAEALDQLWADRAYAARLGEAGYDSYQARHFNWSSVVMRLLA
jgi:glycosyltransferase involved in cell wall biosynthesis